MRKILFLLIGILVVPLMCGGDVKAENSEAKIQGKADKSVVVTVSGIGESF